MTKEDTVRLQTALLATGFDAGPIDGLMGPMTIAASAHFMLEEHADEAVAKRAFARLRPAQGSYLDGIDVSAHNGAIDWPQVAEAGCSFAWIKMTEGTTHKNRYRQENIDGARRANIPHGGYHFARPDTYQSLKLKDAQKEAENFLSSFKNKSHFSLVPALDLESGLLKNDHNYNIEWVLEWCRIVEKEFGKKPLLYTAKWVATSRLLGADQDLLDALATYPLFWAEYRPETAKEPTKSLAPWKDWEVWQWTGHGSIAGVKGRVDQNRMRVSALERLKLA